MRKITFVKSEMPEYIYYTNKTIELELMFRLGEIEIETAPKVDKIKLDLMIRPDMFKRKNPVQNIIIGEEYTNDDADDVIRYDSMNDFVIDLVFRNLDDNSIAYNSERLRSQYDFSSIIDDITECDDTNMSIFDAMVMFLSNVGNNVILQKYFKFIYHYFKYYRPKTEKLEGQLLYCSERTGENKLVVSDKLNLKEFDSDKIIKILNSALLQPMKQIEEYLQSISDTTMKIVPIGEAFANVDPMHEILKIVLNRDVEERTTFVPESFLNIRGYGFGVIHGFPIYSTLNENLDTVIYCIEKSYSSELIYIAETVFKKDKGKKVFRRNYFISDPELHKKLPSNIRSNLLRFNDLLKSLYGDTANNSLLEVLSNNLPAMTINSSDNSLRDGIVSFGFSFDNEVLSVTPTVNSLVIDPRRFCSLMTDGGILFKRKLGNILMNDITNDNKDSRYILQILCKIYDIMEAI